MSIVVERTTKETQIAIELDLSNTPSVSIETGLPFFDHMLHALAFHGGIQCTVRGTGDIEVDPHHLVEDVGIVLGDVIAQFIDKNGPVQRFGQAIIPMDDALSEAVVDLCGRSYLVYQAELPQPRVGTFDVSLIREFLFGLTSHGRFNLHATCRYGENSHHMLEALFKALGRALGAACAPAGNIRSTKGSL